MTPSLSIVVPVRDASYGGALVDRAQVSVNAFLALAERHGTCCELVVVEWNPVADAPRFRELLSWPDSLGPATLRFIEVPASLHEQLPDARLRPFQSATARNVGVRRARGRHILVTGADALPNDALLAFLAREALLDDVFYRIDRRDLGQAIPAEWPLDRQLAFSERQDVVVNTYYGTIREPGNPSRLARLRTRRRHEAILREYRRWEADPEYWSGATFGKDRLVIPADGLHRNGAGDFFLMHRAQWHRLRGYTELPTRGHTDSILCWTAASAGLTQVILEPPLRLFHQAHDRDGVSEWPVTDWRPWYRRYRECRRAGTALVENADDWGLRDEVLPEWTFGGGPQP